ncbi:type II secretion system GspH family protein [Dethiosulfovibrio sp. F2B]|uniref:PilW family protein n=1 Tax=Dethiosulfovibrio faecalis TaxID=2720018 RepID=UPI001F452700|nr:type II secretion system protein [Dethiosulfovibrio faecalis]MCF4150385.1 type II secretion system GspH family protein [Dethiosulfovibrio faecalis]
MIRVYEKGTKKKRAFTLLEVLIALLITSLVAGSAVSLLYTYLRNYEQSSEYTTALEKGQMVLAYLESAVLSAGLGLPSDPGGYSHCVESDSLLKSWGAPVSIVDEGKRIRLVYAVPLDVVTSAMTDFSPGGSTSVSLTGNVGGMTLEQAYLSKSSGQRWVSFLSVEAPFVTDSNGNPLDLVFRGKSPATSAQHDPLIMIRTMEAYASGGVFYVNDNNVSSQPVVKGVLKVFFEELPGNVLKVSVLTRGDVREDSPVPQENLPWPDAGDMPTADDYRYRLSMTTSFWRVRNR